MRVIGLLWMLPLAGQTAEAVLERARQVNLDRASALPNFVVDETAKRYKSKHTNPPKWELFDTVESELALQGGRYQRNQVRRDGKPWNKPDLGDFNWGIVFGTELKPLFDPKCPITFEWEGPAELSGRQHLAYRFESAPDGCFGTLRIRSLFRRARFANPARTGRIVVDDPGSNVIQFTEEIREYPKDFPADPWKRTSTWDYIKIGDAIHLLPVAVDVYGGFTQGDLWHVVVEYRNHRHFESSTSIRFDDAR